MELRLKNEFCILCGQQANFYCSGCDDTNARYCSELCQSNDWKWNHHDLHCGDRLDFELERQDRFSKLPLFIVGPYVYTRRQYQGCEYWFFGEFHHETLDVFKPFSRRLDIEFESGHTFQKQLRFTGSDPTMIDLSRFMYACAAAANRRREKLDIFIEIRAPVEFYRSRLTKEEQDEMEEDIHEHSVFSKTFSAGPMYKTGRLFKYLKCVQFEKESEKECEIRPFTQAHFIDYRVGSEKSHGKFNYSISFILMRLALRPILEFQEGSNHEEDLKTRLKVIVTALIKFLQAIQQDYREKYPSLVLESSNFPEDFVSLFRPFLQILSKDLSAVQIYEKEEYLVSMFKFIDQLENVEFIRGSLLFQNETMQKRELDKLGRENQNLKEKLKSYYLPYESTKTKAQHLELINGLIHSLTKFRETWSFDEEEDFSELIEQLTRSEFWLMDVPALARILRQFHLPTQASSRLKMIYTGAAHTATYAKFFDHLGSKGRPINPFSVQLRPTDIPLGTPIPKGLEDLVWLSISDAKDRAFLNAWLAS